MKELTIEQKAKAYDVALEKAKSKIKNDKDHVLYEDDVIEIFPELTESEDEKIRKRIIDILENDKKHYLEEIAWLEKQGEHAKFRDSIQVGDKVTRNEDGVLVNLSQLKRVTKKDEKQGKQNVEPKFKVGDWIVYDNRVGVIVRILKEHYIISFDGVEEQVSFAFNNRITKWTVQDVKDGDILATQDNILIFEKFLPNDGGVSYCHYDFGCSTPQFNFNKDDNWYFGKEAKVYPATKEQYDLLFQKMHEAGYEWDAERKELRKIKQSAEWSEEDEMQLDAAIHLVSSTGHIGTTNWLKSFKDRVHPKQEWSEEDEEVKQMLIRFLEKSKYDEQSKADMQFYINWINKFKSLRPQSQWKPSEEQLYNLSEAAHYRNGFWDCDILIGLYDDLKKLREE